MNSIKFSTWRWTLVKLKPSSTLSAWKCKTLKLFSTKCVWNSNVNNIIFSELKFPQNDRKLNKRTRIRNEHHRPQTKSFPRKMSRMWHQTRPNSPRQQHDARHRRKTLQSWHEGLLHLRPKISVRSDTKSNSSLRQRGQEKNHFGFEQTNIQSNKFETRQR